MERINRVFIVHKVQLIGDIIAGALKDEPDIRIVGCETDTERAIDRIQDHGCDLVIVNASEPTSDVLGFIRQVTTGDSNVKLLIMGMVTEPETIEQYIQAGATGYVRQEAPMDELLEQIRQLHDGTPQSAPGLARVRRSPQAQPTSRQLDGNPIAP